MTFEPKLPDWSQIEQELVEVDFVGLWNPDEYRIFADYALVALASAPADARNHVVAHWEKTRTQATNGPSIVRRCRLLLVEGEIFVVPEDFRAPRTQRASAKRDLLARVTAEARAHVRADLISNAIQDELVAGGWIKRDATVKVAFVVFGAAEHPMFPRHR